MKDEQRAMPFKKTLLLLTISLVTSLTACNSGSTEEKIHGHLEGAVAIEADFEKHQAEITDLEKKEQELYSEIIDLGAEEFDEIKKASQQATAIIDERSEKIGLEQESIKASQDEFEKTDQLIDKLEEDKAQEKGKEMYDMMMDRYKSYDNLYEAYTESLKLEKELYTMLQKKDVEQDDLTNHITKINDSYEKVLEINKSFNKETIKYNELKKEFYDVADIKVEYEDTEQNEDKSDGDKRRSEERR